MMGRYKQVIGNKLKSRCFESQKTEAKFYIPVLNKNGGARAFCVREGFTS